MLIKTPSGAFTAAGTVMFVGELELKGDKNTKMFKFSLSVGRKEGGNNSVFFTAFDRQAEYVAALNLQKWDIVRVDGEYKKTTGNNGKEYENYYVEFIARQGDIASALAQQTPQQASGVRGAYDDGEEELPPF